MKRTLLLAACLVLAATAVGGAAAYRAGGGPASATTALHCRAQTKTVNGELRLGAVGCNLPVKSLKLTFPQIQRVSGATAVGGSKPTCRGTGTSRITCSVSGGRASGMVIRVKPLVADAKVVGDVVAQNGSRTRLTFAAFSPDPGCTPRAKRASDEDMIIGVVGCRAGPISEVDLTFTKTATADGWVVFLNGKQTGKGPCGGAGTTTLTCPLQTKLHAGASGNGAYVEFFPSCVSGSAVQIRVVATARSTQDTTITCP